MNETLITVIKFIGLVIWIVIRTTWIIVTALVLGGFRGAGKVKMTSGNKER